jgi:hypothetical protein
MQTFSKNVPREVDISENIATFYNPLSIPFKVVAAVIDAVQSSASEFLSRTPFKIVTNRPEVQALLVSDACPPELENFTYTLECSEGVSPAQALCSARDDPSVPYVSQMDAIKVRIDHYENGN